MGSACTSALNRSRAPAVFRLLTRAGYAAQQDSRRAPSRPGRLVAEKRPHRH